MAATSLNDLYLQKLRLAYDAEQQGVDAIPEFAQMASNDDVIRALDQHARESEEQVRRLEQIFQRHGRRAERETCASMQALIQEARETVARIGDPDTIDAHIIAAQQAVEHHEMADYGTMRTWARELGYPEDASLLQQTLDEEKRTDDQLSRIAERRVNRQAAGAERDVTRAARAGGDRSTTGTRGGQGQRQDRGDRGTEPDTRPRL